MQYIYADNFRGFQDTLVPLDQVNFLVGQNSTGKTSLLTLLQVLRGADFLYKLSFRSEDTGFAHFGDIASVASKDRTSFRIGFLHTGDEGLPRSEANSASALGVLLEFSDHESQPMLSHAILVREGFRLHIKISGTELSFLSHEGDDASLASFDSSSFKSWRDFSRTYESQFSKVAQRLSQSADYPRLFIALNYIDSALREQKKAERADGFFPVFATRPFAALAPIRAKPRRTYDEHKTEFSPEGEHTPYVVRRLLENKKEAERCQKFFKKFGRDSGLFESIKIKKHGKGAVAPFELDVRLSRRALGINSVGYGVAQALPIAVEVFSRPRGTEFAIQQPEVHLHPRAQATLGDMIFAFASGEQKRFVVETHSDFLIDRFRLNYKHAADPSRVGAQILYFERDSAGNKIRVMPILASGKIGGDRPDGYREFFRNEALRLLEID